VFRSPTNAELDACGGGGSSADAGFRLAPVEPESGRRLLSTRVAARDRLETHDDYEINRTPEEDVHAVLEHLRAQDEDLATIV